MTGPAVPPPLVILSQSQIAALASPVDYLSSIEDGFRALSDGRAEVPLPWHIGGDGGAFHGKGASVRLDRLYVALKINGNFPANPSTRGLPTIQGAVLLFNGETGTPLAIMDSIEITRRRTAAATALAARHLARSDSGTLLICGCGDQAAAQVEALRDVLPIARIMAWDRDGSRARQLCESTPGMMAVGDLAEGAHEADVIVTCTPTTEPFLNAEMVRPGTFIAAVGADAPHKSEIAPSLMASAMVVADSLDQCGLMGDLHHAIEEGAMARTDVHAELAELVIGTKPGRTTRDQITLFDSTGTAIQDVASAAMLYQRAMGRGAGLKVSLAA